MVDIDADFMKLCQYLQEIDPGSLPLEDGLKSFIRFFDRLLLAFETAPVEKKKELALKLSEMGQKITMATKTLIEGTGMKEEDLITLTSKPEGWNEGLWRLVQEARKQVTESARKIGSLLITLAPAEPKVDEEPIKHDKTKPHQPPKSKWMKS